MFKVGDVVTMNQTFENYLSFMTPSQENLTEAVRHMRAGTPFVIEHTYKIGPDLPMFGLTFLDGGGTFPVDIPDWMLKKGKPNEVVLEVGDV